MTKFSYLSKDKLLQSTEFSNGVSVIANFSNKTKQYHKIDIPGKSIVILQQGKIKQRFTASDFS